MVADDIQKLKQELDGYKQKLTARENEVQNLYEELNESNRRMLEQETENESFKRRIERSTSENDQLLLQLETLNNSILVYEDSEKTLREQVQILKEHVAESTLARDNVIDKLKDVSLETRELIENCENAYEESKLFKNKTEELEVQLRHLREQNKSLVVRNQNFQMELESRAIEISSLRQKLVSFDAKSSANSVDLWKSEVISANVYLQETEKQIMKIINCLNKRELEKRNLMEENVKLKKKNVSLQEQSLMKDKIIERQNKEFQKVKGTVDEYYSEIVRLDVELKDCHKRVSELNINLQMMTSDNLDVVEYMHFKRSLSRFGSVENMESLLSKLQVLQEIEHFFENSLSPHIERLSSGVESDDGIVTDKKQDMISKIKNYLEKALRAIEKLNDRMIHLRTEYEGKHQIKTNEITTLREALSNTMLYNKILEQVLQQYKNNEQLDKAIGNETDELLFANETLLDGFDTLKQLYRISSRSNSFLYAKFEQLKLCFKLLKEYTRNLKENVDPPIKGAKQVRFQLKIDGVFALLTELFEDINRNEPSAQKLVECQQIIGKCENSLAKGHLQNTVENMSQEVKKLTNKVEQEITEKIREIEQLKGEVHDVKINNHELVNKIKNCNHEIISLSTENYDLNEKLESFVNMEKKCELLKEELENGSNVSVEIGQSIEHEKLNKMNAICSSLKAENSNLKQSVITLFDEHKTTLKEIMNQFMSSSFDQAKIINEFSTLMNKCCDMNAKQTDLKHCVHQLRDEVMTDLLLLSKAMNAENSCDNNLIENVSSLKSSCIDIRKEHEKLKSDLVLFLNSFSNDVLPGLHSNFETSLKNSKAGSRIQMQQSMSNILLLTNNLKQSVGVLRSELNQMKGEFSQHLRLIIHDINNSIKFSFENIQSTFTTRNDEMIKEMQEMNSELKKRGETISDLSQSSLELENENGKLTKQLKEKESEVTDLIAKFQVYDGSLKDKNELLEVFKTQLIETETKYVTELQAKSNRVKTLCAELENLNNQIRLKDDTIKSLNDLSKQKDNPDGDVSSVGTISKTDEISRLKDVEDSFEERYTKLRIIAVKMKKSIAELNQQLNTEKAEKATLQNKVSTLADQAKHSQLLQTECDKLNDDVEFKMNEIKELKKIIANSDKKCDGIEKQMFEMNEKLQQREEQMLVAQNEKSEWETKLKLIVTELENIKKEKEADEIVKKEKDKEIMQLKQKLKENGETKRKIQSDLEEARQDMRKQGALTLEMRDFEKTISDLSNDVNEKNHKIDELSEKLNSCADTEVQLTGRIKQLEKQISSHVIHNKETDDLILMLNETVSIHERNLEDREARLRQVTKQLESEKSKNESFQLQLSNSSAEVQALTDVFHQKEKMLNEQVKVLKTELTAAEDSLMRKECEYDKLKSDYDGYKVRAHTILQKLKSENNTEDNEKKLKSEITSLAQTIRDLKNQLDDSLTEIDGQKTQLGLVESMKEKLQKRVKELADRLQSKTNEVESVRAEYRANKLTSDTIANSFKDENEKLKLEIEDLKSKQAMLIETADKSNEMNVSQFTNEDKVSELECFSENGAICNSSNGSHELLENLDEAKTYRKKRKHSLIPLDQLLKSNWNELENPRNDPEFCEKMKFLHEQISYLTNMLNESEKNAARNEQQVSLLKDEIRRLQRTFEREPHLQNNEYLKNVVLKFVSLPIGDEKSHLIAVLETILKLSPNEKEMLQAIAKGYHSDQKQSSGWTSFLGWS